jgi:hypothetical protein
MAPTPAGDAARRTRSCVPLQGRLSVTSNRSSRIHSS